MREFAGHVVFDEIVPLTVVNAGAASIAIVGFAVRPFTLAATFRVLEPVAAGACTDPQPRRICRVVCANPPNVTTPLRRTGSFEELRNNATSGIGKPAGHAAGAITFNV